MKRFPYLVAGFSLCVIGLSCSDKAAKTTEPPLSNAPSGVVANPSVSTPALEAKMIIRAEDAVYGLYSLDEIECLKKNAVIEPTPRLPLYQEYFALQTIGKLWDSGAGDKAVNEIGSKVDEDADRITEIQNNQLVQSKEIDLKKSQLKDLSEQIISNAKNLSDQLESGALDASSYKDLLQSQVLGKIEEREFLKSEITDLNDHYNEYVDSSSIEMARRSSHKEFYGLLRKHIEMDKATSPLTSASVDIDSRSLVFYIDLGTSSFLCNLFRSYEIDSMLSSPAQEVQNGALIVENNLAKYFAYSAAVEAVQTSCRHFLPDPSEVNVNQDTPKDTETFHFESEIDIAQDLKPKIRIRVTDKERVSDVCGTMADELRMHLTSLH
ncbi:MAG: hypothetical protein COV44_09515 [Deltaproteobacteria bacterium CG11_big_fil_rev_8_21_14_0_20_45_16]|nr:MAG: hypothetical protein COV44_09515 [Deltaproteobacteria bacterium CG11_big_fil_rev_8_21_14_0_20_45_16]